MMKYAIAFGLLAAPLAAQAQTVGPVSVEIVATGQVSVPAQRYRMSVTLTAKGKDDAAAGATLAANKAKLMQALATRNIGEAKGDIGTTNSLVGLISSFAGTKSKPSFSLETLEEDSAETPQSTATETLGFDAPTRAAIESAKAPIEANGGKLDDDVLPLLNDSVAPTRAAIESAKAPIEANGGKLDDDVLPLLNDYVAPTRAAKAAAIKKAQGEADAYAATLGLKRSAIVKVSEKQDPTAGALALIGELVTIVAPKKEGGVDQVTVNASLVVEYQLTR